METTTSTSPTAPSPNTLNIQVSGPAPVTSQAASSSTNNSSAGLTATDLAQLEERRRFFQSEADKAKEAAAKSAAEAEAAKQALMEQAAAQKSILEGAAAAATEALSRAREAMEELAKEKAERVKAEFLMLKPHLAAFAKFLPATNDRTQLEAQATELEAAIASQKAADAAKAPPTPAAPSTPQGFNVPAFTPSAPAPSATTSGTTTPDVIQAKLNAAFAETQRPGGDPYAVDKAMAEAIAMANAHVQQQLNS